MVPCSEVKTFTNVLKRLAEKANLHSIGCHGFRHTHATLLFESDNVRSKIIQERLGHSSLQITMDTYTHISDEVTKEATDAFSSYVNFKIANLHQ